MKRLRYIPLYIILLVSASSCSDYLEKAPGVDVTEDTIFSSKLQLETFVAGTYYWHEGPSHFHRYQSELQL